MRHLATIQRVRSVSPIEGADNIELVHVLGWQCVAAKGAFKTGDLCVYFEIDSFIPIDKRFEFLRARSYKNSSILGEGFRLKTAKFRGQISQGLVMKPSEVFNSDILPGLREGDDVTDALGVKEWEEPIPAVLSGIAKGRRPGWIEHSSEERIQSNPDLLEEFRGLEYYITTKYDGSSHFIAVDEENNFRFGSHNLELEAMDIPNSFGKWLADHDIPRKAIEYKKKLGITRFYMIGEWCGEGIQKNKLRLKEPTWFVFTVNVDDRRFPLQGLKEACAFIGVKHVAIEEIGYDLPEKYPTIEALLKRAELNAASVYQGQPEGIVIRPTDSYYTKTVTTEYKTYYKPDKLLSTKVLNNKYLLKNE